MMHACKINHAGTVSQMHFIKYSTPRDTQTDTSDTDTLSCNAIHITGVITTGQVQPPPYDLSDILTQQWHSH